MSEHPLLFTTEMVKAILDGRKTQTRRVPVERYRNWKVGDTIWVRETFRVPNMDYDRKQALMVHYYSDRSYHSVALTDAEMKLWKARKNPFTKTSGRFMYKSLARIFLKITGLRDERVQDINQNDAKAEGCKEWHSEFENIEKHNHPRNYRNSFHDLWDSINAKRYNGIYAWPKNPTVKVIEFKRL